MRTLLATFLTSLLVTASSALAQFDQCGDFDDNGMTTVTDIVLAIQYLYEGGTPPDNFDRSDFDLHQKLTFRDLAHLWQCVFICDFWNVQCPPTEAPFVAVPDPTFKLIHPDAVPANNSKYAIELRTQSTAGGGAVAFCYPLKLRIDGMVPTIDSVVFPIGTPAPPYAVATEFIEHSNGIVTFVGMRNLGGSGYDRFARIYVTIPNSTSEKPLTLEWQTLTPTQAPVGQEDAVFALATRGSFTGEFEPVFDPTCCNVAGDYDNSGNLTISDAVGIIIFIFAVGPGPYCPMEADANGDGVFNISDAVNLVGHIFSGGPAPVCQP